MVATPAADRIARGEEWLQTNTLDGQKAHDSFMRIGEPSYFQELARLDTTSRSALPTRGSSMPAKRRLQWHRPECHRHEVQQHRTGTVTTARMSRTPDERLYSSGTNDSFAFTQCYVSLGDPDGEDFAFTKCDDDGTSPSRVFLPATGR